MMFPRLFLLVPLLLALSAPAQGGAIFRSGNDIRVDQPLDQELIAAGHGLTVSAAIDGDIIAAALTMRIDGPASGDAVLAALELDVTASIAGDLLAVGYDLNVQGAVAGDARLSGAEVRLTRGARVGGDLVASGGEILVEGDVAGDVQLAGDHVVVAGSISGDLDVDSGHLELLPGARIIGDIRYTGPTAMEVPAGVTVSGTMRFHHRAETVEGPTLPGTLGRAVALFLPGLAVLWLWPAQVVRARLEMGRRPGRHLVAGLALLILAPPVILLLMVSLVGIPVGLLLLGLYLLAVPMGLAFAGLTLADGLRRGPPSTPFDAAGLLRRYALVALLAALLSLLPVVGPIILTLGAALGLGTLAAGLMGRRRADLAA